MDADFVLFLALTAFAIAIAGATAFVIFWPLALVHIRDRHPQITARLGEGAFLKPKALWWLLRGDYYATPDRNLSGLATPSRISRRPSCRIPCPATPSHCTCPTTSGPSPPASPPAQQRSS